MSISSTKRNNSIEWRRAHPWTKVPHSVSCESFLMDYATALNILEHESVLADIKEYAEAALISPDNLLKNQLAGKSETVRRALWEWVDKRELALAAEGFDVRAFKKDFLTAYSTIPQTSGEEEDTARRGRPKKRKIVHSEVEFMTVQSRGRKEIQSAFDQCPEVKEAYLKWEEKVSEKSSLPKFLKTALLEYANASLIEWAGILQKASHVDLGECQSQRKEICERVFVAIGSYRVREFSDYAAFTQMMNFYKESLESIFEELSESISKIQVSY